jgi:hypothetical protein
MAGDHSLARRDVTDPVSALAHAQRAANLAVALNVPGDHERAARLDIAQHGGVFGDDRG